MKNKTTAAILAFFLGYFGVHRFYLGQIGLGFVYLILCWTPIIWVVTLIDFIVFLTMSEDNFNMKYNRMYSLNNQQPQVVVNTSYHSGTPPYPQNTTNDDPNEKAVDNSKNSTPEKKIDPFEKSGNEKYEEYDFDGAIKDYLK
jgi:TM2 domain-containing membrane protein YozV